MLPFLTKTSAYPHPGPASRISQSIAVASGPPCLAFSRGRNRGGLRSKACPSPGNGHCTCSTSKVLINTLHKNNATPHHKQYAARPIRSEASNIHSSRSCANFIPPYSIQPALRTMANAPHPWRQRAGSQMIGGGPGGRDQPEPHTAHCRLLCRIACLFPRCCVVCRPGEGVWLCTLQLPCCL